MKDPHDTSKIKHLLFIMCQESTSAFHIFIHWVHKQPNKAGIIINILFAKVWISIPQAHLLKGWSPAHDASGKWKLGPWQYTLERNFGSPGPSSASLFAFQEPWAKCLTLPYASGHDVLPYHRPGNNSNKQSWTETCKTITQNKLIFLLSWLSQVFYCSNRKPTNTQFYIQKS